MKKRPKLILIDDNPDFGGHQVMTAYGLEGILTYGDWEVLALLDPGNEKNRLRWQGIADRFGSERLCIGECPTHTAKFQAVRRYFQTKALLELHARINTYQPDLVLIIQGNIEQGCTGFGLCGRLKCPVISYIPVPHKHADMGAKLGALRDFTCRGLYAEPDGFITISGTLGAMLKAYGARGRIEIVENGIPLDRFKQLLDKRAARANLGVPVDGFVWGQMGRVEFKQKGQDFTLEGFRVRMIDHPDESLAFLGSGPDSPLLEAAVSQCERVYCLPWSDDPSSFLSAIDGLLLPSRYEGVPLVMLEALANGIPVASTNRDGMVDWLPEDWRFRYQDQDDFLRAMSVVKSPDASELSALRKKVWNSHSVSDFQSEFNRALTTWL